MGCCLARVPITLEHVIQKRVIGETWSVAPQRKLEHPQDAFTCFGCSLLSCLMLAGPWLAPAVHDLPS